MHATGTIQVVLGEGEPGLLRMILEAQGFEVVGHARDDDELLVILGVTRPTVVVLDAGISALAAVEARERAHGAPIVVVWPRDAYTSLAEERVDPGGVILELGSAVRRAVERHPVEEPIVIPEADPIPVAEPVAARLRPAGVSTPHQPARRRPGPRHALVAVAAWVLSLTALGTIGLAIPNVVEMFGDDPGGRQPSVTDRPGRALTSDREDGTTLPRAGRREDACAADRPAHPRGLNGSSDDCGGRAFGKDRQGPPPGRGRPDDPGRGSGRGNGPGGKRDDKGKPGSGKPDSGKDGPGKDGPGKDGSDEPGSGKGGDPGKGDSGKDRSGGSNDRADAGDGGDGTEGPKDAGNGGGDARDRGAGEGGGPPGNGGGNPD